MNAVVQRKQLELEQVLEEMANGDYRGIQKAIVEATDGFKELFAIARGESIDERVPTVQEVLAANKLLIERVLPQMRATQVVANYNVKHSGVELDSKDADAKAEALLAEIAESMDV
jgi:hypothetical protein